jgi:hypothetical protein
VAGPFTGGCRVNRCEYQMAAMTPEQVALAQEFYAADVPDGDLLVLVEGNSAVASYYLRCGALGYVPEDGE